METYKLIARYRKYSSWHLSSLGSEWSFEFYRGIYLRKQNVSTTDERWSACKNEVHTWALHRLQATKRLTWNLFLQATASWVPLTSTVIWARLLEAMESSEWWVSFSKSVHVMIWMVCSPVEMASSLLGCLSLQQETASAVFLVDSCFRFSRYTSDHRNSKYMRLLKYLFSFAEYWDLYQGHAHPQLSLQGRPKIRAVVAKDNFSWAMRMTGNAWHITLLLSLFKG